MLNNLMIRRLAKRSCLDLPERPAYNPHTMRRVKLTLQTITAAIVLIIPLTARPVPALADTADNPSLIISQLKITSSDGQFITLYNATDSTIDMGSYQLEYFNDYDPGRATSSRLIALSGSLPPHGYFMVNDDSLLLCYRLTVDSMSLGLSSTAGFIEVVSSDQSGPGAPVTSTVEDYVGWSKKAAAGAQTLPAGAGEFLQRLPVSAGGDPVVETPGAGSWQTVHPDTDDPCQLVGADSGAGGSAPVSTGMGQLLSPAEPPATIIGTDEPPAPRPTLPAHDIGLRAPTLDELLPNPSGTGNDSTSEYIELYNPNPTYFDLTGFSLQTGSTRLHTFKFPAGTRLPAHSFTAFYSYKTKLSLSNTGGQARLLDPFGDSVSASGVYGKAKDGLAWALAQGKWYWTTRPTPGKANVIKQPPTKKKKTSSKSTSKAKSITISPAQTTGNGGTSSVSDQAPTNPIHLRTLVLVVMLALLYGAYEYRADLANHVYRLRRHLGDRHADRT